MIAWRVAARRYHRVYHSQAGGWLTVLQSGTCSWVWLKPRIQMDNQNIWSEK